MNSVAPAELKAMLHDNRELALLDVRENGGFGDGHLLFACSLPFSRLELRMAEMVPRRSTRLVLCDGGEGLAERAAERLRGFGYTDVSVLEGGVQAWRAAGYLLFSGVNVPSKAFGEFVEHQCHTPSITAAELNALMDRGEKLVVLDSRPLEEFKAMSIPGGVDCPGAELVYRVADLAPDANTLVVVNCAGRTRSIIGAQSLINAGIPNKVVALRNGTMGWQLAGLQVERGARRAAPAPSPRGIAFAKAAAEQVARRFAVRTTDAAAVAEWREEPDRTVYLLDVRSPEEFAAGHLPDSRPAPGGQLVQATDAYVATRHARLVLVDDTGVRATMTASWLIQMGWDNVWVLENGLSGVKLEGGPPKAAALGLESARPVVIAPEALAAALEEEAAQVVDLAASREYKAGHIPGAWFAVRSRFATCLPNLPKVPAVVLTSPDGVLARIASADAAQALGRPVRVLRGGTQAWKACGLPLEAGKQHLADIQDDVWLRPYDRETGQEAAMKAYLAWEVDLVDRVNRDGDARFRIVAPGSRED